MKTAIAILTILIALQHFYFLWLEMFAWLSRGPKVFTSLPRELFKPTKGLAANQGLYNGFLAAGLVWSLLVQDVAWAHNIGLFFTSCIAIAGIYGGYTIDKKIFFLQGIPALVASGLLLLQITSG